MQGDAFEAVGALKVVFFCRNIGQKPVRGVTSQIQSRWEIVHGVKHLKTQSVKSDLLWRQKVHPVNVTISTFPKMPIKTEHAAFFKLKTA